MMSSAWAAPTNAPRTRSSSRRRLLRGAPRRPPDGRSDCLAYPNAEEDSNEHDEGPNRRLHQGKGLFEGWQQDQDEAAAGERPDEPDHLRQCPGAEPDHHRDDQDDDHHEVEQVHQSSMDEPAPNVGAGSLPWEMESPAATQRTVTVTGVASPPGELIV